MKQLAALISLSRSEGLRQSAVVIVGNFGATSLSALALILISRVLGPIGFSEFSVGFAVLLILNRINDAGLNAAILKFAGRDPMGTASDQVVSYATRVKVMLSLGLIAIALPLVPLLNTTLNFSSPAILYLAVVLSLTSTWYEHLLTLLQVSHRFTQAVIANVMQSGSKLTGILLLWLLQTHSTVIVFGWYMVAPLVPVLAVFLLLPKKMQISLSTRSISDQSGFWSMARHSAIGFIAAGMIENIDILFVQRALTPFETGLLGGVSRIATMLLMVAYSLSNVLYPRVARYHTAEQRWSFLKKSAAVVGLCFVGFLAYLPFARLSISATVGSEYLSGLPILHILVAASFITIATIPFQALFYSFKADWYFSVSGIGQLAIIILGNALFLDRYGLDAAAWTRFASKVFLFVMTVGVALWLYWQKHVKTVHTSLEH